MSPMRTSYRDIFLLACCQALLLTNAAGLISLNGLVGYQLATDKTLATLGVTTYVLGSAVASYPMALWMGRVGRRRGFMAGAAINIVGCAIGVAALWLHSFALFCVATAVIGVYNAIGLQYRFAAAEVAAPADKARAISLVLAGGVLGGVIGPEAAKWSRTLFATPFLGTLVALAGFAFLALLVQSRVNVPLPAHDEHKAAGARPLAEIAVQPVFIVAVVTAALSYGLMNLLMTATPIAMSFCGHPFGAAATVIEWHVVGMFAPGLATGSLIARFGALKVISAGVLLMAAAIAVALHGISVAHFVIGLALVGVGWNFMYTGGTTLLTESYRPSEKARVQGVNDLVLFVTLAATSLTSGALVTRAGWDTANWAGVPVLAIIAIAVAALAWQRRAIPARA
ncbi:MAG TPA: MFS transporter [Casimicrobiaceae bacterium]|jgi:predicted MFS family arabinose efflux permease|nr:MFS transporter [Casimicrobiaceae bacterium]